MQIRSSLLGDVRQRWLVANYRRFGTAFCSNNAGSSSPRKTDKLSRNFGNLSHEDWTDRLSQNVGNYPWSAWALKIRPTGCTETSVTIYPWSTWALNIRPIGCTETSVTNYSWSAWSLKIGPISCSETSTTHNQSALRGPDIRRGRCLKSNYYGKFASCHILITFLGPFDSRHEDCVILQSVSK